MGAMPEPYICAECAAALAEDRIHSCAEWGRGIDNNLPDCECPDHATWCPDCQIEHHPPVGVEY